MTTKRVNTAHQGRRVEYKVIDYLEARGWEKLQRSAASQGKVDLSFIRPGWLAVVQVKLTDPQCSPIERAELMKVRRYLGARVLPLTVRWPLRAKGPTFRCLTGAGPKDWVPWDADLAHQALSDPEAMLPEVLSA